MESIVFDSRESHEPKVFSIACGYISTTWISFVSEGVTAKIEAKGHVEFYRGDKLLETYDVPRPKDGRELFMHVRCSVSDDSVILGFPVYSWTDNYPHCDGESDRWDADIIGYNDLIFDLVSERTMFSES